MLATSYRLLMAKKVSDVRRVGAPELAKGLQMKIQSMLSIRSQALQVARDRIAAQRMRAAEAQHKTRQHVFLGDSHSFSLFRPSEIHESMESLAAE